MKKKILFLVVMIGMLTGVSSVWATNWNANFISFGWKTGKGKPFKSLWTMPLEAGETTSALKIMGLIGTLERPIDITTVFWKKEKAMAQLERRLNIESQNAKDFAWLVMRGKKGKVKKMAETLAGEDASGKLNLSNEDLHAIMRLAVVYRRVGITKYLIGDRSPFHERFKKWERGIYGACVRIRSFMWFTWKRFFSNTLLFQGHKIGVALDMSLADEKWQREVTVTNATKEQEVPYHQVRAGYYWTWDTGYYFRLYFGGALKVMR